MSTERKNEGKSATAMDERHATGKDARDQQTGNPQGRYQQLNENWTETRNELRKKYNTLTEQDLELKPGREQETIDRVGKRLSKNPEEAFKLVKDAAEQHQRKATPTSETQHKPKA